jgi:Domain of unknown function (DUF4352)
MTDQETAPAPGIRPLEDATTACLAPDSTEVAAPDTTQAVAVMAHSRKERSWFTKKRLYVPSAVLLVFVVIMTSTGGNDPRIFDFTTSTVAPKAESAVNAPPAATIGQSVRDGQFSFIVTSVQPPSKLVTDRLDTTQTAQGEFVIVRLNVTNIGYEAQTVTATDQFLISDQGQRFATSAATSSLQGSERILLEKINPGRSPSPQFDHGRGVA